ncbi:glucose-6-phosphate dehydrogenase [Desulfurivibrio alkaliphilus]|uniref:Glucose-6-phosphate 1-dehydrogenase n=1 Tax=Desulfurivibrio alkaliphilus (strain DSM 19089 / UNIQEM U267 / AHT2) TaxID=589865 RepID=D6Z596_DESAT|nr:glucose-6-phosphate dehydrogenase [Desulfurivibrio alkaliphilus]ADH84753.1 glucose-6-phosphate 1-dehydrogenase [Desulfurivibrio alkaliphilus AHT 2]
MSLQQTDCRQRTTQGSCNLRNSSELPSCSIVIFGASGDLTARKLIPALANLFAHGCLPERFNIVGCGRSAMSHEEFRRHLAEFEPDRQAETSSEGWQRFAANLFYQQLSYDSPDSYRQLAELLNQLDRQRGTAPNRMFYLSVPPALYPVIATQLGPAGLSNQDAAHWSRIVVEKPFGHDLASAQALDQTLHAGFSEEQIFRIDHYLAKETVQNILMLRFANAIFEPLWNRNYVDYVGIISAEKLGVEHRAGFYEQAGVLRDMFQNHMMQLLALTAMEPPSRFKDIQVHDEKTKIFRALKPLNRGRLSDNLVLGQYGPGTIDGREVPGYRQEPGVAPDSLTPTFAAMKLGIDNWRWRGVPFYLVSGKRMPAKESRIVIQFKEVPHSMFNHETAANLLANRLVLEIYPEEKITLNFQAKTPGSKECLHRAEMGFNYERRQGERGAVNFDAYEMVLLDCIIGDHMLFWRQDGVELSWSFLTPILAECESCPETAAKLLQTYPAGTPGPAEAHHWMQLLAN